MPDPYRQSGKTEYMVSWMTLSRKRPANMSQLPAPEGIGWEVTAFHVTTIVTKDDIQDRLYWTWRREVT